jgi:hypothetical protein
MIRAGTYKARAKEWAFGLSQTGKEQIAITFDILDEEERGETITWYGYFSDAALNRTVEALHYCGWDGDNLEQIGHLKDHEVQLVVEDEEYEGKVRTKVRWVNAIRDQLPPEEQRDIAQRICDRILAKKRAAAEPSSRDDDLPF